MSQGLLHPMTDEELVAAAIELADRIAAVENLKADKAEQTKQFNEDIKRAEEGVAALAEELRMQREARN